MDFQSFKQLNKKVSTSTAIAIIIICILLGGVLVGWRYKGLIATEMPQFPIVEENPLAEFEKCVQSSSWQEYREKEFPEVPSTDKLVKPAEIQSPIEKNFSEVGIYQLPLGHAGGDVLTEPILKIDDNYCKGTDSNLQNLFAPITKKEVKKYLKLRLITLAASNYGRSASPVLNEGYYEQKGFEIEEFDKRKVTSVQENENNFTVDWIWHSPTAKAGFYEQKIKVKEDGSIKKLNEPNRFIDLGPGIMF